MTDLATIARDAARPWKDSPYYKNAEKYTNIFWSNDSLFTRLFNELNLNSVVELACGHGRHSEILQLRAKKLILIDVFEDNLDACRARLADKPNVEYILGNGYDFQPIKDQSQTAIVCYDSMVHFPPELVKSYLLDAYRILEPGGMALFHHSNYTSSGDQHYGKNPGARNNMNRAQFNAFAKAASLEIVEAFELKWGGVDNLDGITLLRRPADIVDQAQNKLKDRLNKRKNKERNVVTHQTHLGGPKGQTDSSYKLKRLKLPADLTGKSVLDVGCNEGFFCDAVLRRGAKSVIGIDMDERFLNEAKARYQDERLEFVHQGWQRLPEGPFDLILWTSAMHYELDPAKILKNIANCLSPNGLFVLECGILQTPKKEMVYSIRHDGGNWYPTLPFLEDALTESGLSFRMVSHAELVGTDPVPRVVFHCKKMLPTVLIVGGQSQMGKTHLAELLKGSATKAISLDQFVSRIGAAKFAHNKLQSVIQKAYNGNSLREVYEGIDSSGLTEAYTNLISQGIAATDRLVLIEGYLTDKQIESLKIALSNRARVWVANAQAPATL